MIPDFCKFFQDIEKDPKAKVPRYTVRDSLALKAHVQHCKACFDIVERVAALDPTPNKPSKTLEN